MTAPTPRLTYRQARWERWDGDGIVGDGAPLADVMEVTVHTDGDVWVSGSMRCKDGTKGPNRSRCVRCDLPQPEWLREIIDDALARLTVPRDARTSAAEGDTP